MWPPGTGSAVDALTLANVALLAAMRGAAGKTKKTRKRRRSTTPHKADSKKTRHEHTAHKLSALNLLQHLASGRLPLLALIHI